MSLEENSAGKGQEDEKQEGDEPARHDHGAPLVPLPGAPVAARLRRELLHQQPQRDRLRDLGGAVQRETRLRGPRRPEVVRGEMQANASSREQSTIQGGGERSELQPKGDLTMETPEKVSAQPNTNDKRSSKTRKQKSDSKERSSKKRKEKREKS